MQDTPSTDRWTKRGFIGIPLIGWALLAMAGTAIAVVVFFLNLGVTGNVSLGEGINTDDFAYQSVDNVDGVCAATIDVNGDLAITGLDGLFPGDFCEILVTVANTGSADAEFQNFNSHYDPGPSHVPFFNHRWDSNGDGTEDVDYCGTPLPNNDTAQVGFRLDVYDNMTPNTGYSFGSFDGPVFVPAGAANCN